MSSGDWTDDPELRDSRLAVLRYRSATDGAITGGRSTRKHPVVFRAQMDLTLNDSERAFRDELRAWIEDNHPGPAPHGGDQLQFEFEREWQRRLHEGGWAGISWPKEYGGRGATLVEQSIFGEELARAKAPRPANVLGLVMGGPVVIAHGTQEQKERYLAPILSGDEIWCQGFSEPESGSDLASLKTRARRDGDGWVVSGQKVWTTLAHRAKWCMLLARTNPDAPKHRGITYFLLDMDQPGVEVRPLVQITGEAEFNELFIEDARIPDENVVGEVDQGWPVAITTLMHERAGLAMALQVELQIALAELIDEIKGTPRASDPVVRDRLAQLFIEGQALRLNAFRGITGQMKRGFPGPEGSLGKWHWAEINQALTQLALDLRGPRAIVADSVWAFRYLRARGNSIEGGTTEIPKNIVAEGVLGLPRA
jgi:alkylation response protein AidB-like acyl-CoA dehydrogenase